MAGRGSETLPAHARPFWKLLEPLTDRRSNGQVFEDFLEAALAGLLSQQWARMNERPVVEGPHEAEFEAAISRHHDRQEAIDAFGRALGALVLTIQEDPDSDVLGEVFEARVSFGEHGQFFTPMSLCQMMAAMSIGEDIRQMPLVNDPACGSGRNLIAVWKLRPFALLFGEDVDRRCAIMAALNLHMRGCTGRVLVRNTLSMETRAGWEFSGGRYLSALRIQDQDERARVEAKPKAEDAKNTKALEHQAEFELS